MRYFNITPKDYGSMYAWGDIYLEDVPKDKMNQEFWNEVFNITPHEIFYVPPEFQQPHSFGSLYAKSKLGLDEIPKEKQTKEFWDTVLINNAHKIINAPESYKTPQVWAKAYASAICSNNLSLNQIPKEKQTKEFWEDVLTYAPGKIIDVPKECQTLSNWAKAVGDDPVLLNLIPKSLLNDKLLENVKNFYPSLEAQKMDMIKDAVEYQKYIELSMYTFSLGEKEFAIFKNQSLDNGIYQVKLGKYEAIQYSDLFFENPKLATELNNKIQEFIEQTKDVPQYQKNNIGHEPR